MANGKTPPAQIPEPWKAAVIRLLRRGEKREISTTTQSDIDWGAIFPDATHFDLFDAMADALAAPGISGRLVTGMREPGQVYEFWFYFEHRQLYGKVNLLPSGTLLIYSSHPPRKGSHL